MTSEFFRSADTANRYDRYRPQVHAIYLDWLASAGLQRRYRHAVDIACGTGHSTLPLLRLAEQVDAIDISTGMVEVARAKGMPARVGSYQALPSQTYDFIGICMAFHWFDRQDAVRALGSASVPGAIWLISNFWLEGHESDERFNHWYRTWYASRFPAPQRRDPAFRPTQDEPQLTLVAEGSGTMKIAFDRESLIGYLTTQSNVEHRLGPDYQYAHAEQDLRAHLPMVQESYKFLYGYQYTICRLRGLTHEA